MVKLSRAEQGRTGYSREAGMFPLGAISSSSSSVTSSALLNFTFEELNHHNGEVEQGRTGQNRAEQGRTGQNRAEQGRTVYSREAGMFPVRAISSSSSKVCHGPFLLWNFEFSCCRGFPGWSNSFLF